MSTRPIPIRRKAESRVDCRASTVVTRTAGWGIRTLRCRALGVAPGTNAGARG